MHIIGLLLFFFLVVLPLIYWCANALPVTSGIVFVIVCCFLPFIQWVAIPAVLLGALVGISLLFGKLQTWMRSVRLGWFGSSVFILSVIGLMALGIAGGR